jgi:nitric oxide reductase subunit B
VQERAEPPHKWTFRFLMAVGFWNFVGAGIFGFLINLPIVSYFETGTLITINHGHAAMMGVFGMLGIGTIVFAMRQTVAEALWLDLEKYVRVGFWGLNSGLLMMVVLSLVSCWSPPVRRRAGERILARRSLATPGAASRSY